MKRTALLIVSICLLTTGVFAQLSTRENDDTVLKMGTRPGSGDFALTFAGDILQGNVAPLYNAGFLNPGDLVSIKYFISSDLAFRGGVRLYKYSERLVGDEYEVSVDDGATTAHKQKSSESEYLLVPGIEKHFLKSNVFDAFMGGDLLLGLSRDVIIDNQEASDGTFNNYKETTNGFIFGLGWVIGVNVFVAQLPVSVGVEYGLSLRYDREGVTKIVMEDDVNGETEYYSYTGTNFGGFGGSQFESLGSSEFGMDTNQNVRFVVNVYFGN